MGTMINIDEMFTLKDKYGNGLFCRKGVLELALIAEKGKRRMIGKITDGASGVEYRKGAKEKNVFKKMDAWGLNAYILSKVDMVVITTEDMVYSINAEDSKLMGKTLNFKQQGFERQVFIKRRYWRQEVTPKGKAKLEKEFELKRDEYE